MVKMLLDENHVPSLHEKYWQSIIEKAMMNLHELLNNHPKIIQKNEFELIDANGKIYTLHHPLSTVVERSNNPKQSYINIFDVIKRPNEIINQIN